MPSVSDGNLPTQGDFRTAIAPLNGHGGQGAQHIRRRHGLSRQLNSGSLLSQVLPEPGEDLIFQGGEPIFGGEHLVFQLLQLLGDVTLAVGKGLLADVACGHLVDEGFGNFNIIAEDPVKAYLQGADAGFLPLAGLDGGNGAAAALHNVPEAIGFGIRAFADDAALPDGQGRLVYDGIFNFIGAVRQRVDGLGQLGK